MSTLLTATFYVVINVYKHWTDECLTWNPSEHRNVTQIIIPSDLIWRPEITVQNRYSSLTNNNTAVHTTRSTNMNLKLYLFAII